MDGGGGVVAYTVFSLGDAQLHQLHTPQGKVSKTLPPHLISTGLTFTGQP